MNAVSPPATAVADASPPQQTDMLLLRLDGYEGPLDLLLDLARSQRIDLAGISILQLAEQFLAVIEQARAIRLELAADWLVMAAWLAWLKSRLLLPNETDAPSPGIEADADLLAARLAELARIRALAAVLDRRPVLGRDVFRRGAGEDHVAVDRSGLRLDVPGLLVALVAASRRAGARRPHAPKRHDLPTVADALVRLERMLGALPAWTPLEALLPPPPVTTDDPPSLWRPASLASTLIAGLELARRGACALRQEQPFGPVLIGRPAP